MVLRRSHVLGPPQGRSAGPADSPVPDVSARWPAGRTVGRLAYPTGHGEATTVVDVVLRRRDSRSLPHFRLPEFHPARGYVTGRVVGLDVRSTSVADRSLLIVGSVTALGRPSSADDALEDWPPGVHAEEFVVVPSTFALVPDAGPGAGRDRTESPSSLRDLGPEGRGPWTVGSPHDGTHA